MSEDNDSQIQSRAEDRMGQSTIYSPHVKFLRKWGMRSDGDGEFGWPQGRVSANVLNRGHCC